MSAETFEQMAQRLAKPHWHRDAWNMEYFDVSAYAAAIRDELANGAEPVAWITKDAIGDLEHTGSACCYASDTPEIAMIPLYTFPPSAAARIAELEEQRDELRAAYKQTNAIGRFCLSEDDCIAAGVDFSAYERGLSDAIEAVERSFPTAIAQAKEGK